MFETILLSNLIYNRDYAAKVIPFLKPDYFHDPLQRWTFRVIKDHFAKYNRCPTLESIAIDLQQRSDINEKQFQDTVELVSKIKEEKVDFDWLVDKTEKWCNDKALDNAIDESILILDAEKQGKNKKPRSTIPNILQDALSVSFQKGLNVNLDTLLDAYVLNDDLIQNLFKRSFVYSLTGATGSGKTAVALYIAFCVATNTPIGNRHVNGGRIVYYAGENPADVTERIAGMLDGQSRPDNFLVYPFATREKAELSIAELIRDGEDIALVVIDTSTAYFAGDDENDNTQALEHAKWLRSISTRLPGNPTVLVCCHPTKFATDDNLIPRGGSAFIAEVDGNLASVKEGDFTIVSQHGKYRGVDFPAIGFKRSLAYPEFFKRKFGRTIPTIIAAYAEAEEVAAADTVKQQDSMQVLRLLAVDPKSSLVDIADKLQWRKASGVVEKYRSRMAVDKLRKAGLIEKDDNFNKLTEAGRKALENNKEDAKNFSDTDVERFGKMPV
jgi:DNA-binding MarR family transcriptional regulator